MGLCKDKSLTFLKDLGYNVVRLPKEGIRPLQLLGVHKKDPRILGPFPVTPGVTQPSIKSGSTVANVNGQSSSKLNLEVGLNILGSVISAMGGNLGVKVNWTNADKVEFRYSNVTEDSVVPMDVAAMVENPATQIGGAFVSDYLMGNGGLYIITATLKSKSITVSFEKSSGAGAQIDIPAIQQLVGGTIKVSTDSASQHVVTFEGETALVFGFQCFEVVVDEGGYKLRSSKPGSTFLSATKAGEGSDGAILTEEGGLVNW